jgi:hypothetical protein
MRRTDFVRIKEVIIESSISEDEKRYLVYQIDRRLREIDLNRARRRMRKEAE